ncbi:hypothetical protein [Arabiibacter massiliensis]|uniref:hypothetical protein n=1 Tax=Arabiibacter massiliensis TaxID=1870985 RepID=UPI0009B9F41B|nr:hypothetical protein [Arabiibacter massiliensis]
MTDDKKKLSPEDLEEVAGGEGASVDGKDFAPASASAEYRSDGKDFAPSASASASASEDGIDFCPSK